MLDLARAMDTARRAAEAAAAASLVHFRRGVRVETKPDRTPVTAADRESEAAILAIVRAAFPDHAFLGEETGVHAGSAESRWIVDPLDGTRGFTRGRSFWGPLVALEHEGEIVAGAMALPALGEVYWAARGLGTWMRAGDDAPVRLSVSGVSAWSEATFSMGEPHCLLAPPWRDRVLDLATTSATTRCYGDLAGCALVLTGRAEAWIEAGVQLWDLGPIPILVEEAGGRFTDCDGRRTVGSGHCVASNGKVHDHVLEVLRGR
ncbi:inositol monophosphatase family protein [Polyangium aurulentum]|uniref:inositol monophosphatase family protein n=1 Tax=Polyangium aurulentum TaxID=2567896 RepID=UPI0010AE2967|nr:inositol monophosphatase family protein [Polyangium aurulentum]UQA55485.1 inositol phosphatase [Polyangium aurulentum]